MVHGTVASLFLIPFQQREIQDPGESQHAIIQQPQPLAHLPPQASQGLCHHRRLIGYDENEVTCLRICPGHDARQFSF